MVSSLLRNSDIAIHEEAYDDWIAASIHGNEGW